VPALEGKRQNFNVTPEQAAEIEELREALGAPSAKEAILRAVRIVSLLARETEEGHRLCVESSEGKLSGLLIPELEPPRGPRWKYLVQRPHAWRRQLYVKGRRLPAAQVWSDMLANHQSVREAAENWDLPQEAVREIIRYSEANRALLDMEAEEERRRLVASRVAAASPSAPETSA